MRFKREFAVLAVSFLGSGPVLAGTEGASSTFYGSGAGGAVNAATGEHTVIGSLAGTSLTTGAGNVFVGRRAGLSASTASANVFLGLESGFSATGAFGNTVLGPYAGAALTNGYRNVYIGFGAGFSSTGDHRLYIDNCAREAFDSCDRPLVYGEFDNRVLQFDGVVGVTANRSNAKVASQLHFSVLGMDVGGWLTSAGDNNFFTSSGARYDADAGGWIQRSADGKAVIAGSGAAGFRVLTSSGGAVGSAVVPVSRLHIDYSGAMGVNTAPVAGRAINTSTGAYLSSGGVWTNASSRTLKDDIERLSAEEAQQAFARLEPVRFRYKDEPGTHVGFIAEDVPELVATADRKGVASMDVVAVLTKVVQRQEAQIDRLNAQVRELADQVRKLEKSDEEEGR